MLQDHRFTKNRTTGLLAQVCRGLREFNLPKLIYQCKVQTMTDGRRIFLRTSAVQLFVLSFITLFNEVPTPNFTFFCKIRKQFPDFLVTCLFPVVSSVMFLAEYIPKLGCLKDSFKIPGTGVVQIQAKIVTFLWKGSVSVTNRIILYDMISGW